ncbi:MAG: hypothetical protein HQM16_13905 [Deltaproteobacteria bacterium]|nr:hypothetical protein [Deltaproteobacteria bacterium]
MTVHAYYYLIPQGGTFTRGEDGFVTYETGGVRIRTDKTVPKDTDAYIVIDGTNSKAVVYDNAENAEEFINNAGLSVQYSSYIFDEKTNEPIPSTANLKLGIFAQWDKGVYNLMPNTSDQNGAPIEDYDGGILGDNGRGVIVYLRVNPLGFIPGITGTILGHLSTGVRYDYLSTPDVVPQYSNNDPATFVTEHNLSWNSRVELSLSDFLPDTPIDPSLFAEYDIGKRWTNALYANDGEFTPTKLADSYLNQAWRAGAGLKLNLKNIFGGDISAFLPANLGILFFIEGNQPVNN